MSALRFVTEYPNYFTSSFDRKDDWDRVREQAYEHTRYSENSDIISAARPNESLEVNAYRNNNRRRLTKSAIDKFKTKTSRIFKSSGLGINEESLSDALREYISKETYMYITQRTDFLSYILDVVYAKALDDPNAVEILLPINPENPDVSPLASVEEGGVPKNEDLVIKSIIVSSGKIKAFTRNVFSWDGGYKTIPGLDNSQSYPWFWIVDNEWFYRYLPVRMENGYPVYELENWYFHNTTISEEKIMPVNLVPANIIFDDDDRYAYQTSFISPFLEYADEFASRFSDGQAVWVTSAFPIHVMEEMNCRAPGCINGKVPNPDTKSDMAYIGCSSCNGTGHTQRPSPYGVLVKPDKSGMDAGNTGTPYELINPDTEILSTTYNVPFDLLQKGERQIGLDVLENKVESGVSREMRFEDVKDLLATISSKIAKFMERHLFYLESLLVLSPPSRGKPRVNTPVDFDLKSSVDLKEDALNALPSDRIERTLAYYKLVYKNNERLLKVYDYAFQYSAILLTPWDELKDQLLAGIITDEDVIKRNNVIQIMRKLSIAPNWLKLNFDQVKELVDEALEDQGLILKPLENFELETSPSEEGENRSKLLDTVGGLSGILELTKAVKNGEMSEVAAENILVNIYGLARVIAESIIDVPNPGDIVPGLINDDTV